jgi:ATP-dependent Clp protease ATP-binding subunit ClpA
MGVSKQAAQKRFVGKPADAPAGLNPDGGFEQFTARARNALVVAHNEAQAARHAEIEPLHLLLGLLSDPWSFAVRAVVAAGVPVEPLREAARAALPSGGAEVPPLVPYAAGARDVLQLTVAEAVRLGHDYVGTEHVLLALLEHEGRQPDAGVLRRAGLGKPAVEAQILALLDDRRTGRRQDGGAVD